MIKTTLTWHLTSEEKPPSDAIVFGIFFHPEGFLVTETTCEMNDNGIHCRWYGRNRIRLDDPVYWASTKDILSDPAIQEAIEQAGRKRHDQ